MPIKNLTDNVTPRFPSLGKLRKGSEQVNGQYGKDLTYFRFTSENKDVLRAFHEAYGDQPASLHIYLPYATIDENFSTWKEAWKAGGLIHRCDGETCTIWRTPDGKYSQQPKPCPGGCDEVGRLVMWLPELIKSGYVGYVTLETHSLHDLMNITATLQAVAQTRRNDPAGLQGIEFVLRRKLEKISTPGTDGKRARRDKWLVSLEPVASWAQTYLTLAAGSSAVAALAAPGHVDLDTGEILDDDDNDGGDGDDEVQEGEFTAEDQRAANDAAFNALPSASANLPADRYEGGRVERAKANAGTSGNNGKTTTPAKHDANRPWDDERKAEAVRWAMKTYPGIFKAPQHAMNSLDNCLEAGAAQGLNASQIAQAWKEKCAAKQLELDTPAEPEPPSHADLDAQAAASEKPQF